MGWLRPEGHVLSAWLLVRNSDAGSDDAELVDEVAAGLDAHGGAEVVATADVNELDDALRAADGRTVVVCGGDGSVQLAVERARAMDLLDDLTFGIVPLGTGNDLAGHLGLPDTADQAVAHLLATEPRATDLLVSDEDRVVINAVHIGIGVAAAERADGLKDAFGALAYPLGALVAGVAADGLEVEVELDGARIDLGRSALMVAVTNGATIGGGHAIAPGADVGDGLLDVVVVHAVDAPARVAYAAALLRGTHLDRDDVVAARGASVTIRGGDLAHNRDGELEEAHGDTRTYTVERGAWRVHR